MNCDDKAKPVVRIKIHSKKELEEGAFADAVGRAQVPGQQKRNRSIAAANKEKLRAAIAAIDNGGEIEVDDDQIISQEPANSDNKNSNSSQTKKPPAIPGQLKIKPNELQALLNMIRNQGKLDLEKFNTNSIKKLIAKQINKGIEKALQNSIDLRSGPTGNRAAIDKEINDMKLLRKHILKNLSQNFDSLKVKSWLGLDTLNEVIDKSINEAFVLFENRSFKNKKILDIKIKRQNNILK